MISTNKSGEKERQVGRSEIIARVAEDICEKVHSDLALKHVFKVPKFITKFILKAKKNKMEPPTLSLVAISSCDIKTAILFSDLENDSYPPG